MVPRYILISCILVKCIFHKTSNWYLIIVITVIKILHLEFRISGSGGIWKEPERLLRRMITKTPSSTDDDNDMSFSFVSPGITGRMEKVILPFNCWPVYRKLTYGACTWSENIPHVSVSGIVRRKLRGPIAKSSYCPWKIENIMYVRVCVYLCECV